MIKSEKYYKKIVMISYIIIFLISISTFSFAQQSCASGSSVPSTSGAFVDNNDGTITSEVTGLMWQKCSVGLTGANCDNGNAVLYNWQEALNQADLNEFANYSDWRLPNIKELRSIVEQRCWSPAINLNYFPNTQNAPGYWSSSSHVVYFSSGSSEKSV